MCKVKCIISKYVLGGDLPSTEKFPVCIFYSEIDGKRKQETIFFACVILFRTIH
jgi:hypothetical protein